MKLFPSWLIQRQYTAIYMEGFEVYWSPQISSQLAHYSTVFSIIYFGNGIISRKCL